MGTQEEAEGPVLFPQTVPGVQESLGEGQDENENMHTSSLQGLAL